MFSGPLAVVVQLLRVVQLQWPWYYCSGTVAVVVVQLHLRWLMLMVLQPKCLYWLGLWSPSIKGCKASWWMGRQFNVQWSVGGNKTYSLVGCSRDVGSPSGRWHLAKVCNWGCCVNINSYKHVSSSFGRRNFTDHWLERPIRSTL